MSDICNIECVTLSVIGDNHIVIELEDTSQSIAMVEVAPIIGTINITQEGSALTWIDYVTSQVSDTLLTASFQDGSVTEYTYSNNLSLYRYEKDDGSQDSFYSSFDGTTLAGLVVERYINPIT